MTKFCSGQASNAIKMKVRWGKICARKLWFLCNALHNISIIIHIEFKHVQAINDKVIFQTSRKCCKNFSQREITHRHYEVQLWFFHSALCRIWFFHSALCRIATNTNAKFQVNQTGDDKVIIPTKNYSIMNFIIQGQITSLVLVRLHP